MRLDAGAWIKKQLNPIDLTFKSPCPRGALRDDENEDVLLPNNKFPLYVTLPTVTRGAARGDLFLIVNGWREVTSRSMLSTYLGSDFAISKFLNERGYSSTLLPIPFHYWRRPEKGAYQNKSYTVEHALVGQLIRFYLGYRQLLLDLAEFPLLARAGHWPELTSHAPIRNVHLLGYSLGGLAALSTFVLDKLSGAERFSTCTALFSGASLPNISWPLGLSETLFDDLRAYYQNKEHLNAPLPGGSWVEEEAFSRTNTFDYFVLGNYQNSIRDAVANSTDRVRVIIGLDDHVIPSTRVLDWIPTGSLREEFIRRVKGVGHFLPQEPQWRDRDAKESVNWLLDSLETAHM